jgi:CBS domain-containing membrane protein
MGLTNTMHPPGGATALIALVGGDSVSNLGFSFVLHPVATVRFGLN